MTPKSASAGFAAVGSPPRLQVLTALVRAGNNGLTTGQIQMRLSIPASTLSHHLRTLAGAGVIRQIKQGRAMFNFAEFDHLRNLAGYLLTECCADSCCATAGEAEGG